MNFDFFDSIWEQVKGYPFYMGVGRHGNGVDLLPYRALTGGFWLPTYSHRESLIYNHTCSYKLFDKKVLAKYFGVNCMNEYWTVLDGFLRMRFIDE